jgi:predicted nicotinamide N-methyase
MNQQHNNTPETTCASDLVANDAPLTNINLDNLRFHHLNSPSKIAMARMACLGIDASSLIPSLVVESETVSTGIDAPADATNPFRKWRTDSHGPTKTRMIFQGGGLASYLVRLLSMAMEEWNRSLLSFSQSMDGLLLVGQHHKSHEKAKDTSSSSLLLLLEKDHRPPKQYNGQNEIIMKALNVLKQVLLLLVQVCKYDTTLNEEMARGCGMHCLLSNILGMDVYKILEELFDPTTTTATTTIASREEYERLEDTLIEIQDLAAKLAHVDTTLGYPVKVSPPYTLEELHGRLPLVFSIVSPSGKKKECFMVHQVTERQSAQEDVGFVMWPSAVVLASWLLDHEELVVRGKRVLELGAGCGLTGMVAARMMLARGEGGDGDDDDGGGGQTGSLAPQVILTDFHRKVLRNIRRNISLNGLEDVAKVMHLDFYSHSGTTEHGKVGWKGIDLSLMDDHDPDHHHHHHHHHHHMDQQHHQPPVDLILAADTICKASDSVAVSDTIYHALVPGGEAVVVSADAQHRFGVDIFEKECQRNGLQVTTFNMADLCQGKLVPGSKDHDPCGIRQTSGYVDGMTLTMFRVLKPLS